MNRPLQNRQGERGVILVIVLWSIAAMTAIVVALSAYSRQSLSGAGVEADLFRTGFALESGIAIGAARALAAKPGDRLFFDGEPSDTDMGGGRTLRISVQDAAGLADINRSSPALLEALASQNGATRDEGKALAKRIADLRAEANPNRQETPVEPSDKPQEPVALVFTSTAQTQWLTGISAASAQRLQPWITVHNATGKINPLAAPEAVLRALPGLGPADIATVERARRERRSDDQGLLAVIAKFPAELAIEPGGVFIVSVTAVSGPGLLAGSSRRAVIAMQAAGGRPYQVMAWSW